MGPSTFFRWPVPAGTAMAAAGVASMDCMRLPLLADVDSAHAAKQGLFHRWP
jgi:hypothetical protein